MVKTCVARHDLCITLCFNPGSFISIASDHCPNRHVSPFSIFVTSELFNFSSQPGIFPRLANFHPMASSSPMTSIPLQEPVFLQFLHDVHHAYLLLHRAMALLPPTLIPNIEPTPLPSTEVWNQPTGLQPEYSDATNAFLMRPIFLHLTLQKKKPLWTSYYSTIFLNHINMSRLHHLMLFPLLRNSLRRH